MTEEERFQKVYNVYMNYEHELAQRGMENVAPVASSLTHSYVLHAILEGLQGVDDDTNATVTDIVQSLTMEDWDSQP